MTCTCTAPSQSPRSVDYIVTQPPICLGADYEGNCYSWLQEVGHCANPAVVIGSPAVQVTCPASMNFGAAGNCGAEPNFSIVSAYWKIDGNQIYEANNYSTLSLSSVAAGTHQVQYFGVNSAGSTIASNIASVVINPAPLSLTISCPSQFAYGDGGGCQANPSRTMVSNYWTLDGVRQASYDNQAYFDMSGLGIGTYKVKCYGTDTSGNTASSSERTVQIKISTCLIEGDCIPR